MKTYTFLCFNISHQSHADFSEQYADDAAARARGLELARGEGSPAPHKTRAGHTTTPDAPTPWYAVSVWCEGYLVGEWKEYGEVDALAKWHDEVARYG